MEIPGDLIPISRVLEISLNQAWQMVANGKIKDAKTILLMHFLKQKTVGS